MRSGNKVLFVVQETTVFYLYHSKVLQSVKLNAVPRSSKNDKSCVSVG